MIQIITPRTCLICYIRLNGAGTVHDTDILGIDRLGVDRLNTHRDMFYRNQDKREWSQDGAGQRNGTRARKFRTWTRGVNSKVSELTLALWCQLRFSFLTLSFSMAFIIVLRFLVESPHYVSIPPACDYVPFFPSHSITLIGSYIFYKAHQLIPFLPKPCTFVLILRYIPSNLVSPFYYVFWNFALEARGGGWLLFFPFFRYVRQDSV